MSKDETLGEMRERLAAEIEQLPWFWRWRLRNKLNRLEEDLARKRTESLNRYFRS